MTPEVVMQWVGVATAATLALGVMIGIVCVTAMAVVGTFKVVLDQLGLEWEWTGWFSDRDDR